MQQRTGRQLASLGAAGDRGTFDHRRCGQDDASIAQRGHDRRGDRLPAVGAPGCLRRGLDHQRQVGRDRRAQAQPGREPAAVIGHGLRPAGVGGERRRRDVQLRGQPSHEGLRWLVQVRQHRARVTQQGELRGVAELVGVAATACHELLIGLGKGEAPRQGVRFGRYAEQRVALLVGQQLPSRQGVSPLSHKGP